MKNSLLLFLFSIANFLTAMTAIAGKPNVVNFHRSDYQAASKNWSISQDGQGVTYFGNDNGLLEFDGVRWRLYKLSDNTVIRAVAVACDGLIFTGGYEEFGYWEREMSGGLAYHSLSEEFKDSFQNDEFWKIWVDGSLVFFQSFTKIYVYDRQAVKKFNPGNNILFLLKVRDEYWLQAMGGALYRMTKDGTFDEIDGSRRFANTEIRVILPYGEKDYLIGTSTQGIFIYDGFVFKPWEVDFSRHVVPYELNNGILGSNGHYYFGTILNGLYEVNAHGRVVNHWSADNYLQNSTVLSLYGDMLGNIWVALDRGISFIQYLPHMDSYIDPQGKTGAVYSAAIYNGMLYLGANKGVFVASWDDLKSPDIFRDLKLLEGTQGQVWDMTEVDGELFLGHNKGLKMAVADNTLRTVEGITTGVYKIKKINYSDNEYLFLGTYINARIMKRHNDKWEILVNPALSDLRAPITNIERDHIGNIWLEHAQKGVYRCVFSQDMTQMLTSQFYTSNGTGRLRLFKTGDRVFFAANDSIFVYDDDINKIVFHDGLNRFFKDIKGLRNITQLSANRFWAVTTQNIYLIRSDGQNFDVEYSYLLESRNISLVNNSENIVRLNDTLSLICLDMGFLLHSATGRQQLATPSPPFLRSVSATNFAKETVYLDPLSTKTHRLNFRKSTILFDFFADNAFPKNLFFQYRLDGVVAEWTAPARIHEALFERLPSGNYTFHLRTCNHLNNCSEPIVFSFTIMPPWYRKPLAFLIYIVLFAVSLAFAWKIWLKRLRNQHLLKVRLREEQRLRRHNEELRKEIDDKSLELMTQTKDWNMFMIQFELKHVHFFSRIKADYPHLTPHDLKLCACLKLNMASKDIATLMNISLRSIENSRYRMRKKLGLTTEQNLTEIIMKY